MIELTRSTSSEWNGANNGKNNHACTERTCGSRYHMGVDYVGSSN